MAIVGTAKITSKGKITIPNQIRKLLYLETGASVAFGLTKAGVVLLPCEATAKLPYTAKEWGKIEKLAAKKGKIVSSVDAAKKHLAGL